jgi:DNA processing protein
MRAVADKGCLLSEQFMGVQPRKYVFPQRNRLISALSRIVIVVEAGKRSGANITARWALEQGREIGAVPGFPGDFRSVGVNQLLKTGAALIEGVDDVIKTVPLLLEGHPHSGLVERSGQHPHTGETLGSSVDVCNDQPEVSLVLDALTSTPTEPDILAAHVNESISKVQTILFELELRGVVGRDRTGCYYKRQPGEQ